MNHTNSFDLARRIILQQCLHVGRVDWVPPIALDKLRLKTDPMGRFFEKSPENAAIVWDTNSFQWSDHSWIEQRTKQNALQSPMSIYEVHLGSWRKHNTAESYSYRELADELVGYLQEMGFTHVEFMPIFTYTISIIFFKSVLVDIF